MSQYYTGPISPVKDFHYSSSYKAQGKASTYVPPAPVSSYSTVKKAHPLSGSIVQQTSPSGFLSDDLELCRLRCLELEAQLAAANHEVNKSRQEIEMHKQRSFELDKQRSFELDPRALQEYNKQRSQEIDPRLVELNQTSMQLSGQLDRATKQVHQRKAESESWRQKYETQVQQLGSVKGNYELEIRQLNQQLQKMNAHIENMGLNQNRTISDSIVLADVQNRDLLGSAKSQIVNNIQVHETQIKQLLSTIDDKTLTHSGLETMMERQKCEFNDMQARLKTEIESLKQRISALQLDHQQELNALKCKLDLYKNTEAKNALTAFSNENEFQQAEIHKLKNLLDIKNDEINTLIELSIKQKSASENEINSCREEIADLKKKLLQNEKDHQENNHHLQQNMEKMHNSEINMLKLQFESQIQIISQDLMNHKEMIQQKNNDIHNLQIEKAQSKDFYDGEIDRFQMTLDEHRRKIALIEGEKLREVHDLLLRIERLNEQSNERERELSNQIQVLNQELNNLKNLLNHKQKEIEQGLGNTSLHKSDYESQIRLLNQDIEQLRLKSYELERSKNQEIQDLKSQLQQLEYQSKEKIKQLDLEIAHLKYELGKQKDMYNHKSRECENVHAQKQVIEDLNKKLQNENDTLIQKLQAFEREKNSAIEDLRLRMDDGASFQFDNIKKAYNTQVSILTEQITDLQRILEQKSRDYTELIEKYTILDRSVLPDQLIRDNTYNSRVGVPAEFVANKSVHDVLRNSNLRYSSLRRT